MTRAITWKLFIVIFLALGVRWVVAGNKEPTTESPQREETEMHAEADETPGIVTLDTEALAKSGIAAVPLTLTTQQRERRLAGTVLDRNELLALCRRYAAARERAPELLLALERDARERWGEGIVQGLSGNLPMCTSLAEMHSALIEITQSALDAPPLPPIIWLERPRSGSEPAQQLSFAVTTHPPARTHTYYIARVPSAALIPGQTVTLRFAVEPRQRGVQVPESAVVWLDGKPWVYVQESDSRFVRREFGTQTVAPNERVVITGAQMLLSQEFRSQIHMEEESEHEEGEKGEEQ